jgi:hypothetical protein
MERAACSSRAPHVARSRLERVSIGIEDVQAALASEDPIGTLRAVAIDLCATHGREAARGAFASVCEELAQDGRDQEAAIVAEAIDMLDEWFADGKAWF